MSADNINNYYNLFNEKKNISLINEILIDYNLIYFITGITLLLINIFFVHYFNMLNNADEFEDITPKDFTILVHDVKNKNNNNISNKQYLINLINEISNKYFKLEIHQIISCYNLVELYKLTKEVFEDKTKIYHAKNLKRQKDLNNKKNEIIKKDNNNDIQQNNTMENSGLNVAINSLTRNQSQVSIFNSKKVLDYDNINYYSRFLCFIKSTPLNKIQERIKKKKRKNIRDRKRYQ